MSAADDPLAIARAALAPGEQLIWADRPDPRALARSRLPQFIRGVLGLAVIVGFLWLSFVPNWPEGLRGLLLLLFLAAATAYSLWLLAAPAVASRAASRTVYAVTDRRLLILEDWPRACLRSFVPAELDEPMVSPPARGAGGKALGSVVFIHRKLPWWQRSAGGSYRIEAFYGIAEAQRVAGQITALRSGGHEAPADEDA